jgi:hypothetical protein
MKGIQAGLSSLSYLSWIIKQTLIKHLSLDFVPIQLSFYHCVKPKSVNSPSDLSAGLHFQMPVFVLYTFRATPSFTVKKLTKILSHEVMMQSFQPDS